MDTVPQMISTKDFSYLTDMFTWNYNAYKQIYHYSQEVESADILELCDGLLGMHYSHLQLILAILKGERNFEDWDDEGDETDEG